MNPRIGIALLVAVVLLAGLATWTVQSTYAQTQEVWVTSNASLAGVPGGSSAMHTTPLQACKEYTLRLNYNMVPSGTPVENAIGFQVWNNEGNANLTSAPFGQRKWDGTSQHYYLESIRRTDVPSIEEVRFKTDCADTTPNYGFRVFNYEPGSTLNYSLSLPGGQEG
jgi:hypothetical protein